MTRNANSDTCSTREAAELLGVSVRTCQLWVEEGRLAAWKTPGGHRRITRASVQQMLDEQARAVTQSGPAFGVLVVEDDPVQRRLVEVSLKRHLPDLDIRLATDGFEGLMRIGERTPDVLITDLMMPGLDGFRMLESLQRNNATRGMQIIVITSLEDQQIKERGGLPSSAALMKKPLDSAHLNSLVGAFKIVWESRRSAP